MMLLIKYQCSRPRGLREEYLFLFYFISLCKTFDPWGGAILGPKGHNLKQLGRGIWGDTSYQISNY